MVQTWALVIFFHVGILGDTDSNATSVVHGFSNQQLCELAKKQLPPLVNNTKKEVRAICVRTS